MVHLEHYPAEKLKREILAIIGKHVDLSQYRVFFFGSRVNNRGTDRSDVDVGIEGPERIPPAIWLDIQEEIENLPTLYKVEIVDFGRTPEKFRSVAKQTVESIHP